MIRLLKVLILITAWLIWVPAVAIAATPMTTTFPTDKPSTIQAKTEYKPAQIPPLKVYFGIYPTALYDFDLERGTYKITFYAWWRTTDPKYNPQENIEILDAADIKLTNVVTGHNGNEYYTNARYFVTMHQTWNIKYFPFDRQFLDMNFEDQLAVDEIMLLPDNENSGIRIKKEGWDIIGLKLKSAPNHYDTNFGDISIKDSTYSRLTAVIEIKRQGWRPYFTYFIGFFTAAFLCGMVFLVASETLSGQTGFMLGAVFSAVGNKYMVDQMLPFTNQFTLTDAIEMSTFLLIMITYLTSLGLIMRHDQMRARTFRMLHHVFGIVFLFLYIVFIGIFTYVAVVS